MPKHVSTSDNKHIELEREPIRGNLRRSILERPQVDGVTLVGPVALEAGGPPLAFQGIHGAHIQSLLRLFSASCCWRLLHSPRRAPRPVS